MLFILASVKNDCMACLIILFSVAEVEAAELTIFLMMKGCELLKFLPYRHYSSETCIQVVLNSGLHLLWTNNYLYNQAAGP